MTDLFLDAEEQKQKEVEKELKNTHPIAQAHEAKDIATGTRIKVGDLSQTTKDFLTEVNKEKELLNNAMNELEKDKSEQINNLIALAQEEEKKLQENSNGKLPKQLKIGKTVIAKRGELINPKLIEKLDKINSDLSS